MTTKPTLDEILAKRAAIAEARAAREASAEADPDAILARELQALAEDEAIAEAEDKHGPRAVSVLDTDMGRIVLKRPNATAFKRWQDRGDKAFQADELERLVRPCVVFPAVARFDAILAELPATLTRCADHVAVLAGARKADLAGK